MDREQQRIDMWECVINGVNQHLISLDEVSKLYCAITDTEQPEMVEETKKQWLPQ